MTEFTSPGQDFYEALRAEIREAPHEARAAVRWGMGELDEGIASPWHLLPVDARAVFNAAALRFLSE